MEYCKASGIKFIFLTPNSTTALHLSWNGLQKPFWLDKPMHYYFHWLLLNINSCYGGHSHWMQGVYIHHPFFIASADSILKRHFHLIYDRRKKMQWIHDFCSMTEHAKNVNAVFVHLMCFESLISSCVTAPPNVELLQQPFFPTRAHTHTQVQIDK